MPSFGVWPAINTEYILLGSWKIKSLSVLEDFELLIEESCALFVLATWKSPVYYVHLGFHNVRSKMHAS